MLSAKFKSSVHIYYKKSLWLVIRNLTNKWYFFKYISVKVFYCKVWFTDQNYNPLEIEDSSILNEVTRTIFCLFFFLRKILQHKKA